VHPSRICPRIDSGVNSLRICLQIYSEVRHGAYPERPSTFGVRSSAPPSLGHTRQESAPDPPHHPHGIVRPPPSPPPSASPFTTHLSPVTCHPSPVACHPSPAAEVLRNCRTGANRLRRRDSGKALRGASRRSLAHGYFETVCAEDLSARCEPSRRSLAHGYFETICAEDLSARCGPSRRSLAHGYFETICAEDLSARCEPSRRTFAHCHRRRKGAVTLIAVAATQGFGETGAVEGRERCGRRMRLTESHGYVKQQNRGIARV
jgi:hypothetical protein